MLKYFFNFIYNANVTILIEGTCNIDGLHINVIATNGHSDDCFTYIINNNFLQEIRTLHLLEFILNGQETVSIKPLKTKRC